VGRCGWKEVDGRIVENMWVKRYGCEVLGVTMWVAHMWA